MEAIYSDLHRKWIVMRKDRPELVLASGSSKEEAIYKAKEKLNQEYGKL